MHKMIKGTWNGRNFYLTNLRRYVISNDNFFIISDRGKGLIVAIRHSSVLWRFVYYIRHIVANFHRDFKNADWRRQVVRMAHELEPHIFCQRMTRLESDMEGQTNTSFQQWLRTMESWLAILIPRMSQQQVNQMEVGHVFVEDDRDAMVANHRMARGLRRNLKGHPQSSRIRNKMGIREKSDGKDWRLCRLTGQNRSKCPQRNYHVEQSSRSGGVEYCGRYGPGECCTSVDTSQDK
ncbi:hypothetical protein PVK06_004897 [Gossypium arboreum]|uniref:Uncharacterized protein n=1 Tax=Gossypium arboreum TaxID=29729 RepID=A0ABR0QU41_GOSAR|nr:hypothetical protein PVK06_004897 [Gossypium arboreum]